MPDFFKIYEGRIALIPISGCWIWEGVISKAGYGFCKRNGKVGYAHRFSWELHHGKIPNGMNVLHKCDVPSCVNPNHLFLGTQRENVDDMMNKKRNAFGEKMTNSKLTANDIAEINLLRKWGISFRRIACEFGVGAKTVEDICKGRRWRHLHGITCLSY